MYDPTVSASVCRKNILSFGLDSEIYKKCFCIVVMPWTFRVGKWTQLFGFFFTEVRLNVFSDIFKSRDSSDQSLCTSFYFLSELSWQLFNGYLWGFEGAVVVIGDISRQLVTLISFVRNAIVRHFGFSTCEQLLTFQEWFYVCGLFGYP